MSNTVSLDQESNEANILERIDELASPTLVEYGSQRKKSAKDEDEDSSVMFLTDIKSYFDENLTNKVYSRDLLKYLNVLYDSPLFESHNVKPLREHNLASY